MIRRCTDADSEMIFEIINDAAGTYKGVIPADRWHEPYMSRQELRNEIEAGVSLTNKPILVGTWTDAARAIAFYQKNGYRLPSAEEKEGLLKKYWAIRERQVETLVVLANPKWRSSPDPWQICA